MKFNRVLPTVRVLAAAISLGLAQSLVAQYSQNVVGYVNRAATNGYNFLANPLNNLSNTVNIVIPAPPDGTQLWLWNPTNQVFEPPATYTAGVGWDLLLTLPVGRGFVLRPTSLFTNTFVGEVLQGTLTNFIAGTNRFTLVGSKVPMTGNLTQLFFPPSEGDIVYQFPSLVQHYLDGVTYLSGHGWFDPAGSAGVDGPVVIIADSFFVQHPGPDKNWVRNFTVNRPASALPEPPATAPAIEEISIRNGVATLRIKKATKRYNVQFSLDRVGWTTIATNQSSATWRGPLPNGQFGFFQVVQP